MGVYENLDDIDWLKSVSLPTANKKEKTLPKGAKKPKGILPKGFSPSAPDKDHYTINTYCDNCGKSTVAFIEKGKSKESGMKNADCQHCGCKIKKRRLGIF